MATTLADPPVATDPTPAPDPAQPVAANPPAPAPAPSASVVPETYDLKLPEGSTVDAAFVERTAATARSLGLSNEAGQKLLDTQLADLAARDAAQKEALEKASTEAQAALLKAWTPGGVEYEKQQKTWTDAIKADPEFGGEKFNATVEYSGKALSRFDPQGELKAFLDDYGYGRNPTVLKFLARIGQASSESTVANGGSPTGGTPKSVVNRFYGATTPEPE